MWPCSCGRRAWRERPISRARAPRCAWRISPTPRPWPAAVRGCDVVYHIAATYREAGQGDAAYTRVNVDGTRHVLEGALAAGARRVVHCSTGGVHGHIEHPPANENAPYAPGDVYQRTKLEAERLASAFGASHPLEVVIARPIGIYGPGDIAS